MDYPGYTPNWLARHGAGHTAREISQQPEAWVKVAALLQRTCEDWQPWLAAILKKPGLRVVMTGAGSSAFAGRMLAPSLRERTGLRVDAIATTDIVGNPRAWLDPAVPTLLVSFARSGDSPESVATVRLADKIMADCSQLILTCNADGALARYEADKPHARCILLPDEVDDRSFAMTSSLSSMYLTAALMLNGAPVARSVHQIEAVAGLCAKQFEYWVGTARGLAGQDFRRIVYLGSNGQCGVAEEAALKMLELTAGRVATRFDTPLGVRHGPKFMIDNDSCVVLFHSANPYTRRYEDDLVSEITGDRIARRILTLGPKPGDTLPLAIAEPDDLWLDLAYLVFAQTFAFETSLSLGLTPDNPCPTGEVNRVVKGVTIYPFEE